MVGCAVLCWCGVVCCGVFCVVCAFFVFVGVVVLCLRVRVVLWYVWCGGAWWCVVVRGGAR